MTLREEKAMQPIWRLIEEDVLAAIENGCSTTRELEEELHPATSSLIRRMSLKLVKEGKIGGELTDKGRNMKRWVFWPK